MVLIILTTNATEYFFGCMDQIMTVIPTQPLLLWPETKEQMRKLKMQDGREVGGATGIVFTKLGTQQKHQDY